MDDKSRKRIRAIAKRLHWLAQLIFLIMLVLAGFLASDIPDEIALGSAQLGMLQASSVYTDVFFMGIFERSAAIASFYPPASISELPNWSIEIHKKLRIPTAVYYHDGKKFHWPLVDGKYKSIIAAAESLFTVTSANPDSTYISTSGSVDRWTARDGEVTLYAYHLEDSDFTWGFLRDLDDEYDQWIERLKAARDTVPVESDLRVLNDLFRIHLTAEMRDRDAQSIEEVGHPLTRRYGLALYQSGTDSLLYETPGINYDNEVVEYKFPPDRENPPPVWKAVYNHDYDQGFRRYAKDAAFGTGPPWGTIIITLLGMFMSALFYRWILMLTKPESA